MAALFLLLLCVISSQAAPSKDTVVTNLIVETTTSAASKIDSSVSRYPSLADYENLEYFRSRISILNDGSLLAGAINKLHHISANFTALATLIWNPTDTVICNLAFRSSTFQCGNHIRIHKVQDDDTVLVCGTDAIVPKCRLTTLSSGLTANIGSIITPQPGLVPFHPDFKGLTIENDAFPNGFLAVNYLEAAQDNFGISYQFVDTSGGMIDNTIQYRSIQGSDNWLLTPAAFVDYYADNYTADDSLSFYFIFLTENSVEISGTDNAVIYSRVVRICKNDPGVGIDKGAEPEFRADYFKTYVKAYIYCEKPMPSGANSVPGSTSYQYNTIQKVSLVRDSTYRIGVARRGRVVYGLFTGPTYGPPGSAICVYSADMSGMKDKGIFTIFSEEYSNLRPGQTGCTANNVPNDNPFTCNTATHNASRTMPEFDVLMSPAVDQLTTDPLVELNGITATSIYTTQALVCNSSVSACTSANDLIDLDVMLVGTNDGKILKIVMTYNGTAHVPLISEELSLADSLSIQNMEPQFVDEEFDHLLLSTDSYIYRIPPHRCDRFDTCVECIRARDPHCFWNQHVDSSQRGCKVLPSHNMYNAQTWYQDINHGNVTQWRDCTGAPSNFTVTADVTCSSPGSGDIVVTPESSESTFTVTLTIEQLSSCGAVSGSLPGPQTLTVSGSPITHSYTSLQAYTWYQVNVTSSNIMRTVMFRTCETSPMAPSISAVFPMDDGMLLYPEIGCLTDDIANYDITVDYQYTTCSGPDTGSMSLSGANGSIFTITGLGSYTSINSIRVTVQNSLGSNMFTSTPSLRTIEGAPNAMVTFPSSSVTAGSYNLRVMWNAPSSVCGTFTGYSVYLNSTQITKCNEPTSYNILGLQPNSQYSVGVTVCTIAGEGPMAMVTAMTGPGIPELVDSITVTSSTSNSITFRWNGVEFNDMPGGIYQIQYTCFGHDEPVSANVSSTQYTISDIACPETDCYLRVTAINSQYSGPVGPRFRGVTSCPSMFPSSAAATSIRIEPLSISSITVSWDIPSDNCERRRTFSVTVTQGSNTLCSNETSQSFIQCDGVEYAGSYDIRVTTRIGCTGGTSLMSSASLASYTHCVITNAPRNAAFTRSSGVTLTWDQVARCDSLVVTYNVHWSCGNTPQTATVTSGTSYTLDVADQISYTYCLGQVQACNDVGCGRLSDNVAVLVPLQPPPAVSITGAVNGTTVLIMFFVSEPTDLADLRYTLFRRQISPNPETGFTTIMNDVQYNFNNVLEDDEPGEQETYEYQLQLRNSLGTSAPSNKINETTTQEPPPGSPMNITVRQQDLDLVVEWSPVSSSSELTYTIVYDTVPPSNGLMFTMSRITGSSFTIPREALALDRACSVGVRAKDERITFYGAWSYAENCFVSSMIPPGAPTIELIYDHPWFELKWDPSADTNGYILDYIIRLRNATVQDDSGDCRDICNENTYQYSFSVEPEPTMYLERINVTDNTCFCASVEARNGGGTSPRSFASQFYKYVPSIIIIDRGSSIANGNGNDDDDSPPIVAIILGIVLLAVLAVTVLLAFVFVNLYSSRNKSKSGSS